MNDVDKATTWPFVVGDRIKNLHFPWEPLATVTELTEHGFKYRLDEPIIQTRPCYGLYQEGECYELEYNGWELANKPAHIATTLASAALEMATVWLVLQTN